MAELIHDTELEKSVLGAIIGNEDVLNDISDYLAGDPFYDGQNVKLYDIIKEVLKEGNPVDEPMVGFKVMRTGDDDLIRRFTEVLGAGTRDYVMHAKVLMQMDIKRKLWVLSKRIETSSLNDTEDIADIISDARKDLDRLTYNGPIDSIKSMMEVQTILYENVNANKSGKVTQGMVTGFDILDRSGGLHKNDLVVIAAESSQGKTALAMSMVLNTASINNTGSAVYSMEMTSLQLAARFNSMVSRISSSDLLYKQIHDSDIERLDKAINKLNGMSIYFDDRSNSNVDTIITSIRRMKTKFDISLAVVDYLQMLTINSGQRNRSENSMLGEIARKLKNLAKELNICIIALSQLNRDRDNPLPTIGRLRSSGEIAEAADVVLLIYRPEVIENGRVNRYPEPYVDVDTHNTAMLHVAKGRNTGLAKDIVGFVPQCTLFQGLDDIPQASAEQKQVKRELIDNDLPF